MTGHESVRFTLLDQQIVDAEGLPIGRVDDLILQLPGDKGSPEITHLLVGAQALGERLGGVLGSTMASVARRLRSGGRPADPVQIPTSMVGDHENLVHLLVPLRELPDVAGLETWLATNVVQDIPGADDADQ